ncbi:hypothetical protein ABPG72_001266 [Tetrahymena utriculariae]
MKFSYQKTILITLLLLVNGINGFLDYNEEHLLNCKDYHTNQQLQTTLIIHSIDKWVFLILAPFAILSTLFIMLTFYKYPTTRKQPGDIILAISISDFVLCVHWIISSAYSLYYEIGPDPDGAFCQSNSFFSVAAGTTEFTYNCCFCLYVIFVIRNNLKGQVIPQKIFHLACGGITILIVILLFATKSSGLSLFGTCSFKVNEGFPVFGVVILFAYLFISWYTIWYFRKSIPNNQIFKKMREEFLRYYFYYVVSTSVVWTILAFSNLLAGLNCSYFQDPSMNVLITIGNAAKIGTPIILSIIRYKDPTIKKKVRDQLCRWGFIRKNRPSLTNPLNPYSSNPSQHISLSEQQRRQSSEDGSSWFTKLTQNLRMTQIYAMISGIIINDIIQKKQEIPQNDSSINGPSKINITNPLVALNDEDYTVEQEIELNDELISQYLPFHKHEQGSPSVEGKATVHAPKVFRALQQSDGLMADIQVSFNLIENIQSIQKKFGGPDGGKSGEFFYFTQDRKMIIKTMNKGELDALLKNLKKYVIHLVLNQDSLIVKIYGIYTFQINKTQNHVLIMRNISQCPSEYIERTFDLKGSTYDREVISQKKNKGKKLSEMTMKDIDFKNTEGKIWIEKKFAKRCSESLEKDARLFESCGLIDYSLIVFKINWIKYSIDTQVEIQDILTKFHSDLNIIESTKEVGIYYHIGIIDYLQEWNVQKNLEQNTKKILNLNGNLDTSAQNQKIYADRFINEIAKGIFDV